MTTFLLIISLLLNGIAIFSVIVLFLRQNRLLEVENRQEKMMKDMEEIISSYLYEMKEENEAFIQRFQKSAHINERQLAKQDHAALPPNEGTKRQSLQGESKITEEWTEKAAGAFKQQAVKAYQSNAAENKNKEVIPELPDDGKDHPQSASSEPDLEAAPKDSPDEIYRDLFVNQVMILKQQGHSVETIARKLHKGKTEIELLLKFAQNHGH